MGVFVESSLPPRISHRDVLICFSDVRGFTNYCHKLQRRSLNSQIQNFLKDYFPIYMQGLFWEILDDLEKDVIPIETKAWLAEKTRLMVPTSYKNLGDGLMIVWELDNASSPFVQFMVAKSIVYAVERMMILFETLFTDTQYADIDDYSDDVTELRLGFSLARGHAIRLDFPGKTMPDYAGSIINLAARLVQLARPEGIVATIDVARSSFEERVKDDDGRIVKVKDIKGMEGETIQVWTSNKVEIDGWQVSVYYEATGEKHADYPKMVYSFAKNPTGDPNNPDASDSDSDGLSDGEEFEAGTNPSSDDTDGDGITDYDEINGETPSDPLGIEGTPPTLENLNIESVKVKAEILGIKVTVGYKMEISVDVSDNVGLDWVEFHVKGIDKKKVFLSGDPSEPVAMTFDTDWKKSLFSGYDLNITAADVNLNIGYLEEHIPSILELFLKALLDALKALAEFIMELASAAIEWIWNAISNLVNRFLEPIKEASINYVNGILTSMNSGINDYETNGEVSSQSQDNFKDSIINQFFLTVIGIVIILVLIQSIIKFFCPFMAWLLLAVVVVVFVILLAYIALSISEDDVNKDNADTSQSGADPFHYMLNSRTSSQGLATREEVTCGAGFWAMIKIEFSALNAFISCKETPDKIKKYIIIGIFIVTLFVIMGSLLAPLIWWGDASAQNNAAGFAVGFAIVMWLNALIRFVKDPDNPWFLVVVLFGIVVIGVGLAFWLG